MKAALRYGSAVNMTVSGHEHPPVSRLIGDKGGTIRHLRNADARHYRTIPQDQGATVTSTFA